MEIGDKEVWIKFMVIHFQIIRVCEDICVLHKYERTISAEGDINN